MLCNDTGAHNGGAKLLIVDDTPANLSLLYKLLEPMGCRVSVANSGEKALQVAENLQPDLILLDVMMPGMDGFSTCRQLRESVATRDTPVIFITAKSTLEDVVEGFTAGAVDYISKPFRAEEVRARVETHLKLQLLRKERDQLLRRSEQQADYLSAVFNHVADGIFTLTECAHVETPNPALYKLLGIEKNNQTLLPEQLFGDDVKSECARLIAGLERPGDSASRQIVVRRSDGSNVDAELVLTLMNSDTKRYVGVLRDVSRHVQLERELRQLSHVDSLTGVANRREFDRRLHQEWERARRSDSHVGLIMLDIDYFKQYNDGYGHQAGDRCLQQVGRTLERCVARRQDLVARYGGEEFVVLIADANPEGLLLIAERIRRNIAELDIEHIFSPGEKTLTVSSGAAVANANSVATSQALIEAADQALYHAKNSGRNRCELADGYSLADCV